MSMATKKLSLIERLMKVRKEGTLKQVEEILLQAEMESRTKESINAIKNGDTSTLDQFARKNKAWLNRKPTKS